MTNLRIERPRGATFAVAVLAITVIAGCGRDKAKVEQPAELTKIQQTLRVNQAWRVGVGDKTEALKLGLQPATDGQRIYAASHDGRVVAVDAANGDTVWRTELDRTFSAGPAFGESRLALGSSDGDLTLISALDGREIWTRNIGSEVLASPLVVRGLVIVRSVDGRLRAFEQSDGSERWSVRREVPSLTHRGNSAPALSNNKVVAAFDDGVLSALEIASGEVLWETPLSSQRGRTVIERLADVDADVVAVGSELYVVGYQSRAARVSADSGQVLWSTDQSAFHPPALDWGRVYLTDEESEVVGMDRGTGAELWRQNALRLRQVSGPVAVGRAVVVGDFEGYLHWLDSDNGDFIGRNRVSGSAITNPPIVLGSMLYVQDDGGDLTAYRLPTEDEG